MCCTYRYCMCIYDELLCTESKMWLNKVHSQNCMCSIIMQLLFIMQTLKGIQAWEKPVREMQQSRKYKGFRACYQWKDMTSETVQQIFQDWAKSISRLLEQNVLWADEVIVTPDELGGEDFGWTVLGIEPHSNSGTNDVGHWCGLQSFGVEQGLKVNF